jgi:hypothetical protein
MELVDVSVGQMDADEGELRAEVSRWVDGGDRGEAIRTYVALTGCSEYRAAELADMSRAAEFREERQRQAEAEARRERAEASHWMAERATVQQYARLGVTPPSSPLEVARHHAAMMDDGPVRDASAPYGSSLNPAFFVNTSRGPVDVGFERERAHARAERSLNEAAEDALIARAKAMHEDSFMTTQISRAQSRRKAEALRAERAELEAAASRATQPTASGLGWPEYPEITRTTRDAFTAIA